jgi:hypothetical protein
MSRLDRPEISIQADMSEIPWILSRLADALERIEVHALRHADQAERQTAILRDMAAEEMAHHDAMIARSSGPNSPV